MFKIVSIYFLSVVYNNVNMVWIFLLFVFDVFIFIELFLIIWIERYYIRVGLCCYIYFDVGLLLFFFFCDWGFIFVI